MADEDDDDIESKLDFSLEPLDPEEDTSETEEDDPDSGDPELQNQLDELREQVENLEQLIQRTPLLQNPFIASVTTSNTFTELCILNGSQVAFTAGRSGTSIPLASGQALVVEYTDTPSKRFVTLSGGGGGTATVNVLTGLTVVGSNGTLNYQNLTVVAANATSSSNITLPSGSGSTLIFNKTDPPDAAIVGGSGFFEGFATQTPIFTATQSGMLITIRASGQFTGSTATEGFVGVGVFQADEPDVSEENAVAAAISYMTIGSCGTAATWVLDAQIIIVGTEEDLMHSNLNFELGNVAQLLFTSDPYANGQDSRNPVNPANIDGPFDGSATSFLKIKAFMANAGWSMTLDTFDVRLEGP